MMTTQRYKLLLRAIFLLGAFVCVDPTSALARDEHSVEVLMQALQTPLPSPAQSQAQQEDARVMSSGRDAKGRTIRQASNDNMRVVQTIADQLFRAMGEDPRKWTIRVLETTPPTSDITVSGGAFIHVYTGLLQKATSKDDIAFVLAHEVGHSLLKHTRVPHSGLEEREADALAGRGIS